METDWNTIFFDHSCPHYDASENNSSEESEKGAERVGVCAMEALSKEKEGWQGITRWTQDTLRWVWSVQSSGGIDFFIDRLYEPATKTFKPYAWFSVAHKPKAICFTREKYWRLFNQRKGGSVDRGEELATLGKQLGDDNPLTTGDIKNHRELKKLAVRHNYGLNKIKLRSPAIFHVADRCLDHYCFREESPVKINFNEVAIQYISRANGVAILAPPGSKSYDEFYNAFFTKDDFPNPDWDKIPQAVVEVGDFVNNAVLYSPRYILNQTFDKFVGLIRKLGLVDEEVLPEASTQRFTQVLDEAVVAIRKMSQKALESSKAAEKCGSSDSEGLIENFLKSEVSDNIIDSNIRLLLVVGQRTTAITILSALKNLMIYDKWQIRIRKEIREKLSDQKVTYESVKCLQELDCFLLETLRLNPPVLIQSRDAKETITFEDKGRSVTIEPGTTMFYAHYFAQRDSEIFEKPFKFKSDRFNSEEKLELKQKFHPFSLHPSDCCGQWLAIVVIKMFLVNLLSKSVVLPYDPEEVLKTKHKGGIILGNDKPLYGIARPLKDPIIFSGDTRE